MTSTTLSLNSTTVTSTDAPTRPVLHTDVTRGVVASVATTAVAVIARGAGVSLAVSGKAIPLLGFAQLTLVGALFGIAIAATLTRRATRARTTFVTTTVVLITLSLLPDVLADAHTSTRLTLVLTHLVGHHHPAGITTRRASRTTARSS